MIAIANNIILEFKLQKGDEKEEEMGIFVVHWTDVVVWPLKVATNCHEQWQMLQATFNACYFA